MSTPQTRLRYYTIEEYLEMERASEEKHEYLDGQILAMAGETEEHNLICMNVGSELRDRLKGQSCLAMSKDMKIRSGPEPQVKTASPPKGFFSYPNVLVVCGERQYHDSYRDVLLNPKVIIEVLSSSTAEFDYGEKFRRYRTWLTELTDYILVSQSAPVIEHYRKQPSGDWLLSSVEGLENSLQIASIGCTLQLSEVYDRVEFKKPRIEQNDVEASDIESDQS